MPDSRTVPAHLAPPPADRAAYERLYAILYRVDEVCHADPDSWRTIRLPPGLSALEVYRRLPTAPDQEFGGYLTLKTIRWVPGWEDGAHILAARGTTWHSHPLAHPWAEIPSILDVYSYLRYRNLRHVTVGARTIWTFDKNAETLATVDRLNRFETRNMIEAITRVGFEEYRLLALQSIGLRMSPTLEEYSRVWPQRLREDLGIRVTIFDKGPEGEAER